VSQPQQLLQGPIPCKEGFSNAVSKILVEAKLIALYKKARTSGEPCDSNEISDNWQYCPLK
jgi:hypothetical protein